ncbi:hypothetical protein HU200_048870 [Digitaria exilis]|uniref:Rx N-terminal domain-containing protein n=1 Tax=Digitaria exilis TaxID=1010633 RepID=A0A835EAG2_9POAL|nr:hypothetical protein HU200_048870 [Digitaria exilis]
MADLVLGLAKMTVQGTVTMAKSAMEDEAKLHKSVERDLVVISDEFEMMRAFLNHAKEDHDTDDMTRTMVRQVRNMAIDMEDCIETILHLDKKPHWWRRMMPPWCLLAMGPVKDLDAAVANIEQLKARVEAMGQRNLRYNRIGEPGGHKPKKTHQQATVNAIEPNLFVTAVLSTNLVASFNSMSSRLLFSGSTVAGGIRDDSDYDINSDDDDNDVDEYYDCDQQKEKENETKPDKAMDSVHQLKVISVLGTGNNIEMMSIMKAYEDPETCKNFNHRAWVKLVHPFNPAEFIRSLLAQFYNNCCPEQDSSEDVLKLMVTIDNALIMEFMRKISEKYLVVLENVSSMVDWEAVRAYLPDKKNGSCIVVHTRQFETACSCVGSGFQVLQMDKLSADDHVIVLLKEVHL